jgi:hypothetical protein
MHGKQIIPAEEMAGKVRAIADARTRSRKDIASAKTGYSARLR